MFDVVIPTYGGAQLLAQAVDALPTEMNIAIIDDAGPEEKEIQKIALDRKHVRYFRRKENKGFPATANFGMSKVGGTKFVLLLNSDVILEPNALEVLFSEMKDPDVCIAAPMLVFPEVSEWGTPSAIQHVGMAANVQGQILHLFVGWSVDNERAVQRRELTLVTGACMLIRMSAWKQVKGFDPIYGKGTYEDVEFCYMVKAMGGKVICNPDARGIHYVGQSVKRAGGYDLSRNYQIFRSRLGHLLTHDDYKYW